VLNEKICDDNETGSDGFEHNLNYDHSICLERLEKPMRYINQDGWYASHDPKCEAKVVTTLPHITY